MASPAAALPSPPSSAPSPGPPAPPKLVNLYYKRAVATSKSCFVCHRETTCCLATEGVTDFLYVCPSHLLDPGFARPAPSSTAPSAAPSPTGSPAPSPVPQSEIDKVKKEYEEKQKRKADAAPAPVDKDAKDKTPASTAFSLLKTGASALSSLSATASSQLFPAPPPATPSAVETARAAAKDAKVFVLQRDFFRMRSDAKRREWEKKDAKERGGAWSFPKAPRGGLPGA
ncbi:hypothetical protein JCM10450v2_002946 [Rhodotorula kratochvilovae]